MGQTMENDYDAERCSGTFGWKSKWMQSFAHSNVFLAVFCLTSVLQGMYYTYFVSILTTIEKLYQIQSKTMGTIMSITEVGQIVASLILTYYGSHGHRPKWIAYGMIVFAISSILSALPHFLFSKQTESSMSAENATVLNEFKTKLCYKNTSTSSPSSALDNDELFVRVTEFNSRFKYNSFPRTSYPDSFSGEFSLPHIAQVRIDEKDLCEDNLTAKTHTRIRNIILGIFFVSLLFIGIGSTAVYTIGIPYIDDNVASRDSPVYFAITIGVRIFGPVFGFLLGSFCTSIHVNWPFQSTEFRTDNPKWIGAWWLGVLIVGVSLIIMSLPMMSFPKELPFRSKHSSKSQNNNVVSIKCQSYQQKPHSSENAANPSIKDFPSTIKRLLKNKILLLRTASSVLHILPISGFYTFLPKYLESQFQLTAAKANMITGLAGILVMGLGILGSGTYLHKYKPKARFVAKWIALCAFLYTIGMLILQGFGCPTSRYVGLNVESEYELKTEIHCNATCHCNPGEFAPICTSNGVTYLSPCLAGCSEMKSTSDHKYTYSNCECLGPHVSATDGLCTLQCSDLYQYIAVFTIFVMIHSTSEVGSMLLTLRCVDSKDKTMAMGLIYFAIGILGNVPCPIIYGAVVDSACLFWEDNCGVRGACRVYDPVQFRKIFHGVTCFFMFLAFLVDCIVWHKAKAIQFEDVKAGKEEETFSSDDALSVLETTV